MSKPAPREGERAPAFCLPGDGGRDICLTDLTGPGADRKVVLFFYPKDDTSGCTKEAIAFSESLTKFKRAGAVVIGLSRDSVAKHQKFKAKHNLKVPLLADENGKVCEKYGVWVEKKLYGRTYMGIERSTFLIVGGKIHRLWRKVKVAGHAEEVLSAVKGIGTI